MFNYVLDVDKFKPGFIFNYKGNDNIVVGENVNGCYILDIEYDKEFSSKENPIYFVSWGTLSKDLIDDEDNSYFFIKDDSINNDDVNGFLYL